MASVREDLAGALEDGSLVELRFDDGATLLGWVVAIGAEWVVLHQINDGLWLDGYAAVPLATVDAYRDRDAADDGFVRRVAEHRGYARHIPDGLNMTGTATVIESLAGPAGLVALDFRDDESTYSEIGELVSVEAGAATLRSIGTDARWQGLETVDLAGLQGVTVGDGYLEALALAARD